MTTKEQADLRARLAIVHEEAGVRDGITSRMNALRAKQPGLSDLELLRVLAGEDDEARTLAGDKSAPELGEAEPEAVQICFDADEGGDVRVWVTKRRRKSPGSTRRGRR